MAASDVVVVGGGIAGASLAYALAREGLGVTVLEASTEYEDRVRGESMHTWGVNEARELGVESVLLDAGAHVAPALEAVDRGQRRSPPTSRCRSWSPGSTAPSTCATPMRARRSPTPPRRPERRSSGACAT